MARKIVLFIVGYFVWLGLILFVGMNALNTALVDKRSPFDATTGPLVLLVGALIVFGAPIVIFLIWFYHTPKWEKELQESGKLAAATILEVKDTGVRTGSRYNGTHWLRVKLQVQPTGDAPFEVVLEKSADKIFGMRQGSSINVKYDPNNTKHVVIVPVDGQPAQGAGAAIWPSNAVYTQNGLIGRRDMTQQLLELVKLHQEGQLSDSEFEAAKKKLLT